MSVSEESYNATRELLQIAKVEKGGIFVVGCSTSEVCGNQIGTNSDLSVAEELFDGIFKAVKEAGLYLAVQCCEHLNRAICIEKEALSRDAEQVNVIPQKKAGGSLATVAYQRFEHPAMVERIRADCGMDIGGTLIGMHLKEVAVPVRLSVSKIGKANILCARTRRKYIGGCRAVYEE